jgi:thiamine transporter
MNQNTTGHKHYFSTRILAELTVFVALTIVLRDVLPPLFEMPQGGSVTIAGLVPIIWFSLRRGLKSGVIAGAVYGTINAFLPGAYIVHPIQGMLDYTLAFGALGLAGGFRKIPLLGVATGILGRFLCSFAAGIIFFTFLSIDGITASAIYNGIYLIPEFAITFTVVYLLLKKNLINIYK